MRIVAISDMHGNLEMGHSAILKTRPDLTLCCGDWGDRGQIDPNTLQAILAESPVLSVYGNHDDLELLSAINNSDGSPVLIAQGEVREHGGFRFAGISGIWAKSHRKPYYVTDEDVARYASELANQRVDVLISHGCPVGIADAAPGGRHGGQRCFPVQNDTTSFHVVSFCTPAFGCADILIQERPHLRSGGARRQGMWKHSLTSCTK